MSSTLLGRHRDCGGPVRDVPLCRNYRTKKCTRCGASGIHPSDIVEGPASRPGPKPKRQRCQLETKLSALASAIGTHHSRRHVRNKLR